MPGTWTFSGWSSEDADISAGSFAMPDKNVSIRGSWTFTPDTYTVTWVNDDGAVLETDENVPYGATPSYDGETPSKAATEEGTYTFAGWTPAIANVTADATYTATFALAGVEDPGTGYMVDTKTRKHTYEIYQIFRGDYTDDEDGKPILSNIVWGEDANLPESLNEGDSIGEDVLNALNGVIDEELDKDKLAEIEKYVDFSKGPIKTITIDGDGPASVDLPAGYYLIRDVPESQTDAQDEAYTTYITVIVKDYTIQPKVVTPTVDKQVADDDEGDNTSEDNATNKNPGGGWYESADHAINETFQFKLVATVPASAHLADYNAYRLVFHDTLSEGVTFEKLVSVVVDGQKIVSVGETGEEGEPADKAWEAHSVTLTDGYTCTAKDQQAGGEWTLTIDDVKATGIDLTQGATVTVVYDARLNESAIVHTESAESTDTNKNSVWLAYSNNPNVDVHPEEDYDDDMGKTAPDTVWVFTYQASNTKADESGNPLANAGFRLYDAAGTTEIPVAWSEAKGAYVPTTGDGVEMMSAAGTGVFNIAGLDVGTYTLRETTTPPGYNTCEDQAITIAAAHRETDATDKAGLDLTGSAMTTEIVNHSGALLPTTGGPGTAGFYTAGSLLVLIAAVLLGKKKREEV